MRIFLPLYRYKKEKLGYERLFLTPKTLFLLLFGQVILSILIITFLSIFLNTPKEAKLKHDIDELKYDFYVIDKKTNDVLYLLETLEKKDSVVYRSLFSSSDTIDKFESGYISNYEGTYMDTLVHIGNKLSNVEHKLERANYYFRKLIINIDGNNQRLKHTPAIQPISNIDLKRTSSGFGMRTHPIYNIKKFHHGMDFVAPVGTPIHATADGIVVISSKSFYGYGKYIKIDHGFGYQTAYAHLDEIHVKKNQEIKRGDIIGTLGNTGLSTGPHLHYEVIHNNKRVDPINYYFQDLSADQYEEMLRISSSIEKSLD